MVSENEVRDEMQAIQGYGCNYFALARLTHYYD